MWKLEYIEYFSHLKKLLVDRLLLNIKKIININKKYL